MIWSLKSLTANVSAQRFQPRAASPVKQAIAAVRSANFPAHPQSNPKLQAANDPAGIAANRATSGPSGTA